MFTVIEVCSREYGDYSEKMSAAVDNGKCLRWFKDNSETRKPIVRRASQYDTVSNHLYDFSSSGWSQFNVLLRRMMIQHKRDYVRDKKKKAIIYPYEKRLQRFIFSPIYYSNCSCTRSSA